jgi:cobalt-zinc-cadmium efflux system protein
VGTHHSHAEAHHGHDHAHDTSHRHDHGHGHGHGHHHGSHANERRLVIALAITAAFMLVEVVGGVISGSLALIADAGHMLTDAGSLALALFAVRASRRPANSVYSYGHHRYEVLAAFVNGLALLVLSAWIIFEAVQRLRVPETVRGDVMLITAGLGLAANVAGFFVLRQGDSNLNVRAAILHVIGDALGSAATMVAAGLILATAWTPIDPLLSAFVAVLILRGGWNITRQSAHILLEGTPIGFEVENVERDLVASVPGVSSVHHVHVWSLNGERAMMTLHAVLSEDADRNSTLHAIQRRLRERFGVDHATVQLERHECPDAQVEAHPCNDSHGSHRA